MGNELTTQDDLLPKRDWEDWEQPLHEIQALYDPEEFDAILREIVERLTAGETLLRICRDDHMPAYRTVYRWQAKNKRIQATFRRAREAGAAAKVERSEEIAEEALAGAYHPHAARLMVETLRWSAARHAPHVYGDRLQVEHDVGPSLKDAMRAGRERALARASRPISDQPDVVDAEVVDSAGEAEAGATDT